MCVCGEGGAVMGWYPSCADVVGPVLLQQLASEPGARWGILLFGVSVLTCIRVASSVMSQF